MKRIVLIYTGGTIGMKANASGKLAPVNFEELKRFIPELGLLQANLEVHTLEPPIDSSDMDGSHWVALVEIIEREYHNCDGFVILHGTDTMAFTASALSFLMPGIRKPVVLTGSQLPLGVLRTDAVENVLSALEYATLEDQDGAPLVQEVAVYFEYKLYRGNRVYKRSSNDFDAFSSPNYPYLARSGVQVRVEPDRLWRTKLPEPSFQKKVGNALGVVTLFPGLDFSTMPVLSHWNVLLLRTYGAGNVPSTPAFAQYLSRLSANGTLVINTSQCVSGSVFPGLYESSSSLEHATVLSAGDLTFESALTKTMVLLGQSLDHEAFQVKFSASLCGERSN